MISWWELEEDGSPFSDTFGGYSADCASCPAVTTGILGDAQWFDGTDEVDVPDYDQFDLGSNESFTIEFWMNTTASTSGNRVMVGRDDPGTPLHMWVGANNDGYPYFGLRSTNNVNQGITGTTQLNDGNWHHIVAVRDEDSNQNRLYVDGELEADVVHDYAGTYAGNADINIGYLNLGGHYRYEGALDEIAIYSEALSETDIDAHYNGGLGEKYCFLAGPVITSSPVTDATVGQLYSYDVDAAGFPAPIFSLTTAPAGMTINASSGVISWTPTGTGDEAVTVMAANGEGTDSQSFTIAVAEPPPCPADMISYWQLDETSGTSYLDFFDGNDGTASPSPPTPALDGIVGGCQDFDGTSNYYTVADAPSLDWAADASFTIELWAKLTNVASRNKVMIGRDQSGGTPHWWVGAQQNSGLVLFNLRDSSGNGTACTGTTAIHDDTWHHIVAVRDEGLNQNRLYVDGGLEATQTFDYGADFAAITTLGVGYMAYNGVPDYFYDGKLDEIALYARALDVTEITEHYTSGLAGYGYCEDAAVPPVITSAPVTDGMVGQLFYYDVDATGDPAPTFSLSTYPTGMTINAVTGVITWTPAAPGDFGVKVRAVNSGGADDQIFTVHVVEAPDCPAGTAHYWPLDETGGAPYADLWAGNDAYCATGCPAATAGLVAGAQWFDGGDDEVDVADDDSFDWAADASFTLAFWMQTNQSTAGNRVILGRDDSANGLHWWIGADNNGTVRFQLKDSSDNGLYLGGIGPVLNDGDWHYITAVRDESLDYNAIYVDGEVIADGNYDYLADFGSPSNMPMTVGYLNLGAHYRYHGALDEVAMYGRALAMDEIGQQYLNGLSGHGYCESFAPGIVTTPVTDGTVDALYSYDVDATGRPAPTYGLTDSPAGMTIDPVSGLIEWTPTSGGDVAVTVEASNSAKGTDTQSFTISVFAPGPCPGSMISYWRLDETAGPPYVDIHDGFDGGCGSCPAPVAGILGGAQHFNGTSTEVDVPDLDQYEFNHDDSFSIEFWMHTSASTAGNRVIVGRDATNTNLHMWVGASDGGQAHFGLLDNNNHYEGCTGTSTINDGVWHHIVAVRDESLNQNRIYVDGVPETTITYDYTGDFSGAAALNIGYLNLSGHFRYEGDVDEIAIYREALSDATILAHYNGGAGQEYCDPIAPEITSLPGTEALLDQLYSYDVEATGIPTAGYALTTAPAGMTIDAVTGLIQWTPVAGGDFAVTVEASNSAKGTDSQSFTVHVTVPPECLAGTISYWKLDETSGTTYVDHYDGNHGLASATPPTPALGGLVGGCQDFNGSNNWIDVPDDPALDWAADASFTIVLWARFTNASSPNKVMVGRDQAGGDPHWWVGATHTSGVATFNLLDITTSGVACNGTTALNDDEWHMIVAVRDEDLNQNRLYVDGGLEDLQPYDYAAGFEASTPLGIGYMAYNYNPGYYYDGLLDEIALYSRALTVAEIEQQYLNGIHGHGYCTAFAADIVSTPTSEFIGDVYSYDVDAIGHPAPTYSLLTPHEGLSIDGVTGELVWTPELLLPGIHTITVEACNESGCDQQTFTIETDVVSIGVGPLLAATTGSGIQLSWTYEVEALDGFHIYRQTETGPWEQLTDTPLRGQNGRIEFLDPVYGLANGTALTYRYGWLTDSGEFMHGREVEIQLNGVTPTALKLHPGYPNPFNPMVNIKFDLPNASHSKLSIYDVSGRLVQVLVDEVLPAATHLRQWNGLDRHGRPVPSGIYYARLDSKVGFMTQKLMLVR
ncbi:MAG: LamG-like jellyroll fold domain-containing protein [bacterium]